MNSATLFLINCKTNQFNNKTFNPYDIKHFFQLVKTCVYIYYHIFYAHISLF